MPIYSYTFMLPSFNNSSRPEDLVYIYIYIYLILFYFTAGLTNTFTNTLTILSTNTFTNICTRAARRYRGGATRAPQSARKGARKEVR